LLSGGERGGKSHTSGIFGATRTPYGELFWIVGPDYQQARPEFEYWIAALQRVGAIKSQRDISTPKMGSCTAITKTGQLIQTKTSDDVRKLASVAPDGIIMAEAAQQDYEVYLKCIGRVAEKRGWLLMSGTFEGSLGWYAEKFEEWQHDNMEGGQSWCMPSWTNTVIYPGGREDPEILRLEQLYEPVEGLFEERIGARPVPSPYLIFREFRHYIHVQEKLAEFDPTLPVYLAIDPAAGTNPYAVLACQFPPHVRKEAHPDPIDYCNVIDELYITGKISEDIIELAKTKYWWKNVQGGAIDVMADDERKRWLKYGKVRLHSDKIRQLQGIRRLKSFLYYKRDPKTLEITDYPHLRIHPRVRSLPFEFGKFRRPEPKDTDHAAKDEPPKDQHNHSIKALWYLLIARYGEVKATRTARPVYNYKTKSVVQPVMMGTQPVTSKEPISIMSAREALDA